MSAEDAPVKKGFFVGVLLSLGSGHQVDRTMSGSRAAENGLIIEMGQQDGESTIRPRIFDFVFTIAIKAGGALKYGPV